MGDKNKNFEDLITWGRDIRKTRQTGQQIETHTDGHIDTRISFIFNDNNVILTKLYHIPIQINKKLNQLTYFIILMPYRSFDIRCHFISNELTFLGV